MITAANLKRLSTLDEQVLTVLAKGLYAKRNDKFTGAKFLGLTNGGEFCYNVVYQVEGETNRAKVFVKLDPATDRVTASMS